MAGFFSLGNYSGRSSSSGNNNNNSTTSTSSATHNHPTAEINFGSNHQGLVLYRNEESIYQHQHKGFEIWQQHCVQVHHTPTVHPQDHLAALAGPTSSRRAAGGQINGGDYLNQWCFSSTPGRGSTSMRGSGLGFGGGVNCQDCGNQAKKDCPHMRCRTCCKSRGFECATHVKSTWVPAAKRRERQQQLAALQQLEMVREGQKRQREVGGSRSVVPSSSAPPPLSSGRGISGSAGLEVGHLPPEVSSPAVFRCVKVSATADEAAEQYAYQTAVNIGGHVFKGILYDHGPDTRYDTGDPSCGGTAGGSQTHNLLTATATTVATGSGGGATANLAAQLVDPAVYPTPINAFLAGTQFFPPPRS